MSPSEEPTEATARTRRSVAEMRAAAQEHARQIDAVLWLTVEDLAGRWGVAKGTVRAIPREQLKYLTLGKSNVRRYHPDDVATYEEAARKETQSPTSQERSA